MSHTPDTRKMTDLPEEQRPRERLITQGAHTLSNEELIAILLRTGIKGCNVFELAHRFCRRFSPITKLRGFSVSELKGYLKQPLADGDAILGIGNDKLTTLLAAIELGARVFGRETQNLSKPMVTPRDIATFMFADTSRYEREGFWAIYVDHHRRLIQQQPELITLGLRTQTVIEPSALFRRAIMLGAHGIYIVHNHPSGDVRPSEEDVTTTERLIAAGHTLGITIHDHIILGRPDTTPAYFSLRANDTCAF